MMNKRTATHPTDITLGKRRNSRRWFGAGILIWMIVLTGCGSSESWTAELSNVGRVVEISPDLIRQIGEDIDGFVPQVGNPEPRLLVYEFERDQGRVIDTLAEIAPLPSRVLFVRSKLGMRRLEQMSEPNGSLLILLRPLLEASWGGVGLEGLLVSLDSSGTVTDSDWSEHVEDLAEVVAIGPDSLSAVSDLIQAENAQVLGRELTSRQQDLLDSAN